MMNFNAVQQLQQQAMLGAMGMAYGVAAAPPPPPPPGGGVHHLPPGAIPQQSAANAMNPYIQNQYATAAFGQIAVNAAPPVQPLLPVQPPPPVSSHSIHFLSCYITWLCEHIFLENYF